MADIIDDANATAELQLKVALRNVKNIKKLVAVGYCYNCNEGVGQGMTFCDPDCRDDYEADLAAKRRAGR